MSTENTVVQDAQNAAAEAGHKVQDTVNTYIDRLMEGHTRLAAAVGTTRERNARVADKMIDTVLSGQREALELTKTFVSQPTAYGKNMEAFMQSLTNAQERTIDLAKTVYKEQAEATAEARELVEPLIPDAAAFGKPFEKVTEMFSKTAR